MSKRDFIVLADYLRGEDYTPAQLAVLARFCKSRNPRFWCIIAAAPRMLEVLRAAELYLSELSERAGDDSEWNRGGNGYAITEGVRALLRDVEGESNG